LADRQWDVLEPLLNEVRPWAARPIREFRRTIEAIVWRQQNGAKWRSVPAELGPLGSRRRGSRSCGDGWPAPPIMVDGGADLHPLGAARGLGAPASASAGTLWARARHGAAALLPRLDGTVIRAHQKAAGARKQDLTPAASAEAQALGRSRGGFGTKGHVLADAGGRAIAFVITPGQAAELPQAEGRCWVSCRARRCGRSPIVATPAMRCARRSGASAPPRRSRPGRTRRRLPVVPGSMSIASGSSGCGRA
jgi:hypothetical protein